MDQVLLNQYKFACSRLRLPRAQQIGDFPCHTGVGTQLLATAADRVVGCDRNETAIQRCKEQRIPRAEFHAVGPEHLDKEVRPGALDAIVCLGYLDALNPEQLEALLIGFFRLLSPGGRFIGGVTNKSAAESGGLPKSVNSAERFEAVGAKAGFHSLGNWYQNQDAPQRWPSCLQHRLFEWVKPAKTGLLAWPTAAGGRVQHQTSPRQLHWSGWDAKDAANNCRQFNAHLGWKTWVPGSSEAPDSLVGIAPSLDGSQPYKKTASSGLLLEPLTVLGESIYQDHLAGNTFRRIFSFNPLVAPAHFELIPWPSFMPAFLTEVPRHYASRKQHRVVMALGGGRELPSIEQPNDFTWIRQEAVEALSNLLPKGEFTFFGRRWQQRMERFSLAAQSCFLGGNDGSPNETRTLMARSHFALIVENSDDPVWSAGYITEKIWNAWIAGAIPIYAGCADIRNRFPSDLYLDFHDFANWNELVAAITNISETELHSRRKAMRQFLFTDAAQEYSYERVFSTITKHFQAPPFSHFKMPPSKGPASESRRPERALADPAPRKFNPGQPLLSFCIITNAGLPEEQKRIPYLERVLQSILSLALPEHACEIIVAGAVPNLPAGTTRLELPDLARTGQVGKLRNALIDMARGEWIVHCDDDILFAPSYWDAVLPRLDGAEDIFCTRLLNPNGTRYWDWPAYIPGKGQTLLPYEVQDEHVYATGGHGIYRKRIFQKIRWNESIRHGGNEEWDLAAQARKSHLRFGFVPQATVYLQYHHCDALAAVSGQPAEPAEPASGEFVEILNSLGGNPAPPPRSALTEPLRSRLEHKWTRQPPQDEKPQIQVSILVGCYRYLQRFRVYAQALCHQTFEPDRYEIIVGNPNSPDGLHDYLATLQAACSTVDPRSGKRKGPHIKEIMVEDRHYRNRGHMVQKALEQSQGQILIGMDCDVVAPRDFLFNMHALVMKNPNRVIGVYRKFLSPETTSQILAGLLDPLDHSQPALQEDRQEPEGYRGVLGYCQAAARVHWEKVGGYPVQFDNIAKSDVEFVEQLAKIGVQPLFVREIELLHLHHPRNWNGTSDFL